MPAALTLFAECAAAAPDWSAPAAALGNLLRRIGRTDDALVAYGRALELAPADADIYLSRGNLCNDRREYEAAIIDYERSAKIRPDWYLPDLNRGNALAAQGALDAAREAYDQALLKNGPAGIRLRRDLLLPVVPADAASYADALKSMPLRSTRSPKIHQPFRTRSPKRREAVSISPITERMSSRGNRNSPNSI